MARVEVRRITAPNPGPMTLEGTNTYLVRSVTGEVALIDPGPLDEVHLAAIDREAAALGGVDAVLLTHSHLDHAEAVSALDVGVSFVGGGETVAGLEAISTPGHSADHVCFFARADGICFVGDLLLGTGSGLVPPRAEGGSLADYLESLERVRDLGPSVLLPGHGPAIEDPLEALSRYLNHRLDRERRLIEAIEAGERSRSRLLATVWDDVPEELRPAAALAMQAHVEKLEAEGLPVDELED